MPTHHTETPKLTDGQGREVLLQDLKGETNRALQEAQSAKVQLPLAQSPAYKAYQELAKQGKLNIYPHDGPNKGRRITGDVSCYVTAANTMNMMAKLWGQEHECYPSQENLVYTNTKAEQRYIAKEAIPKLVKAATLPVGTVFWIKGRFDIKDPASLNAQAKNHWFILVGFRPEKDGTRTPLFLDQGSMGKSTPRPVEEILGTKDRYLHKVFVPDFLLNPSWRAKMPKLV